MKKLTTYEELNDLLSAAATSAALGAAIETGLLWLLADTPLDGDHVAQAMGIPTQRCHYWLQVLEALGILEVTPQGYRPSGLARTAILERRSQESWQHLALDERERSAGVHNLALYLREPGSMWAAQGITEPKDYVEKMRASSARARDFTRMIDEVHQRMASEIAGLLDLNGVRGLMDVGGGSGVVSMALLRKHPGLTATVIDQENVCIAGREIAAENGFTDRITYLVRDLERDDFPGGFDLVMLCDVGLFGADLFRRLAAALTPGGRLVIVFHFPPAEKLAPLRRLVWTFLDSLEDPDFRFPTLGETRAQLQQAGLQPIPGEHTLFDQRVVVQAGK